METLYEKIGGAETIEKLITSFYTRVLGDPMLLPFFENTSIEKLKVMQQAFFSVALGGPAPPAEVSLRGVHRDRGIKRDHLTKFTDHLMATLLEIGVNEKDAHLVRARIAIYSDEILGDTTVDG